MKMTKKVTSIIVVCSLMAVMLFGKPIVVKADQCLHGVLEVYTNPEEKDVYNSNTVCFMIYTHRYVRCHHCFKILHDEIIGDGTPVEHNVVEKKTGEDSKFYYFHKECSKCGRDYGTYSVPKDGSWEYDSIEKQY